MKKRATLLIINLEKIYTMDMVNKHPLVFSMPLSPSTMTDSGSRLRQLEEYADKDTRILDGRGHIAVPGFIEVEAQLSTASERRSAQTAGGYSICRNRTLTLACRVAVQQPFVNSPALRYWMQALRAYRLCRMQACSKKTEASLPNFCISAAGQLCDSRIGCVRHSSWGWRRSVMHGHCCRH